MTTIQVIALMFFIQKVDAAPIQLRYSTSWMPFEPPVLFATRTLDLAEKKSGGKVKIKRFFGGALGDTQEQLGLAKSGAADIVSLQQDQYPQELPLIMCTNSEQRVSNEKAVANVAALVNEIPETKAILQREAKKNNIKMLSFYASGATGITSIAQINKLDDFKGKRLNVLNATTRDVFKELGWIPVNVAIPELYEGLSRGVIDAIFMATAANIPLKWYEIGKQHTILGMNAVAGAPLAFNLDTWNRLPADVQKAFEEASWETALWSAEANDKQIEDVYAKFKEQGARVFQLSKEESDKFFQVLFKWLTQNWTDIYKAAGVEKEGKIMLKYWDEMRWGRY